MAIVYRLVKGSPLTKAEFDNNFHDVDDRIVDLATTVVANPAIVGFTVVGDLFYVDFSDDTQMGPYQLPAISWTPRGVWLPSTSYAVHDLVSYAGALYEVGFNHTSEATFDPNANAGPGNEYYLLLIPAPPSPGTAEVVETSSSSIVASSSLASKYIRCINGALVTFPNDSSVNHDIGTEMHWRQCSLDGQIEFVGASGVTLNWPDGFEPVTYGRGAVITWKKVAANEWDGFGLFAVDPSA